MPIPPQEPLDPEKSYTADEVQHLLARMMAAQQLEDLKTNLGKTREEMQKEQSALRSLIAELGIKIETAVNSLMHTIGRGSDQIRECRKELEADISLQYATKIEMTAMEGRINTSLSGIKTELKNLFIMGTIVICAAMFFINIFLDGKT